MLTLQQKIFLVQCYGKGDKCYRQVIQEFNEKFPNVYVPETSCRKIILKFLRTGSLLRIPRIKDNEDDASTLLILHSVEEHPKLSLRRRAENLQFIKKSQIQKVLKRNKIHPYKPVFNHFLEVGDEAKRLDFCLWVGSMKNGFHKKIMFSDESTFSTNGVVASQHARYWSDSNPHFRIPHRRQYFTKVNVWCAISYHGIIGPYFFDTSCNANSYLDVLTNFLDGELENLPLEYRRSFYFQQDGCPAHYAANVRQWLDHTFPEQWIGRQGPVEWPPRSPDLTIMDFFLWGRLKQIVYRESLTDYNIDQLKDAIRDAVTSISLDEVRRSYDELLFRLKTCAQYGGSVFE